LIGFRGERKMRFKNEEIRSIEADVTSTLMGGAKIECAAPKQWKGKRVRKSLIEDDE
jgi:hypothetical protein